MFGATGSGDTSGYGGLVRSVASAGSSSRPFGSYFDDVADSLERAYPAFSDAIEKIVIDRDELTMHVRANRLLEVAKILRDEPSLRFEMCLGVSGAHYPAETGRELHAIFPLLSLTHNRRIRLEVSIPDANPHMPSVVSIWAGNNWHERETFDMFGIIFDGHPGLTRILMPDDWAGHPQRKDYALGGIPVEYKGATVPPPSERRAYR
ncbi:MAG: NADH-quinone oxidoreductase subunit C [Actinomycetes bacterium]|jgi:NADH-quinone oxidoreductase subunit C